MENLKYEKILKMLIYLYIIYITYNQMTFYNSGIFLKHI